MFSYASMFQLARVSMLYVKCPSNPNYILRLTNIRTHPRLSSNVPSDLQTGVNKNYVIYETHRMYVAYTTCVSDNESGKSSKAYACTRLLS
jgi:hypothetical protein